MTKIYLLMIVSGRAGEDRWQHPGAAFESRVEAERVARKLQLTVEEGIALAAQYEEELRLWEEAHPYPTDAYGEYESLKSAHWKSEFDRLYEAREDDSFESFEQRGEMLEASVKRWEEDHVHLHWGTLQDSWRRSYRVHLEGLRSYQRFVEYWAPLREKWRWGERPSEVEISVTEVAAHFSK